MNDGRIVVSGLTKQYKSLTAVDDLSFTVEPGRVTGFLGPNGAGKTTTLRMLLGLVMPTAGTATIGGQRYVDLPEPARVVGAVLEASSAHRGRTGRNHLRAGCLTNGLPMTRTEEVLDLVGLMPAADRKFKGYSLGMRQRLGIAAAMLGDPKVLILDEPANGLDPEGIRWMRELLQRLAADGRTVLVSSHLLSEMQALADDVVIVAAGQLVRQGTVTEVLTSMGGDGVVQARTPEPERLATALRAIGATATADGPERLLILGVTPARVGETALAAGVVLHHLSVDQPDLEDVFLDLTHTKAAIR
ncbi:ABC transporter ATP-binding protein [Actinoplanes sp. L3-i22]|uniref:ABC transporter ATP-binding protein n=1 Tax=Actinoplanes sp. L3-i22 TaxID=2836373 RepID=UPI001C75C6D3|nr:ATP-binding cassette domain-containing protein [Actinoplanes sp. L3-i22]BCY11538.1 multidrug ABC transporter ATP-binding protein [Actinoplanes sp. L3-i22]